MITETEKQQLKSLGLAVIEKEAQAILNLKNRIQDNFAIACQYMLACQGRIVVLGMGKSGHIAGKIAATLASTGTPAFFVHPGEASHGDLGMITTKDVVIALSNSGETDEILTLMPLLKRLEVPLIALTGNEQSTLAQKSDVHIDTGVAQEACPLDLAPTSSTTATLAMGDALAVALLEARGFTAEDFARSHPGGKLGKRLLLLISDIMHTGDDLPMVPETASLKQALLAISQKGFGIVAVVNSKQKLLGVFTDGDLRRSLDHAMDLNTTMISEVMTKQCKTIQADKLAVEALQHMEHYKINALFVVDSQQTLIGVLNMHDLLRAKVV